MFAVLAVALAAPQVNPADAQAQVLKYDSDNAGIDGYNFAWVPKRKLKLS